MSFKQPITQVRLTNIAVVRYKYKGKRFEIACFPNKVLDWRKKIEHDILSVLQSDTIFKNVSKGEIVNNKDLMETFETTDRIKICKIILDKGQLQISELERKSDLQSKTREIVTHITDLCVDAETGLPVPLRTIESLMDTLSYSVSLTRPSKQQAVEAFKLLRTRIPIERIRLRMHVIIPLSLHSDFYQSLWEAYSNFYYNSTLDISSQTKLAPTNVIIETESDTNSLNDESLEQRNLHSIPYDATLIIDPSFYRSVEDFCNVQNTQLAKYHITPCSVEILDLKVDEVEMRKLYPYINTFDMATMTLTQNHYENINSDDELLDEMLNIDINPKKSSKVKQAKAMKKSSKSTISIDQEEDIPEFQKEKEAQEKLQQFAKPDDSDDMGEPKRKNKQISKRTSKINKTSPYIGFSKEDYSAELAIISARSLDDDYVIDNSNDTQSTLKSAQQSKTSTKGSSKLSASYKNNKDYDNDEYNEDVLNILNKSQVKVLREEDLADEASVLLIHKNTAKTSLATDQLADFNNDSNEISDDYDYNEYKERVSDVSDSSSEEEVFDPISNIFVSRPKNSITEDQLQSEGSTSMTKYYNTPVQQRHQQLRKEIMTIPTSKQEALAYFSKKYEGRFFGDSEISSRLSAPTLNAYKQKQGLTEPVEVKPIDSNTISSILVKTNSNSSGKHRKTGSLKFPKSVNFTEEDEEVELSSNSQSEDRSFVEANVIAEDHVDAADYSSTDLEDQMRDLMGEDSYSSKPNTNETPDSSGLEEDGQDGIQEEGDTKKTKQKKKRVIKRVITRVIRRKKVIDE